MNFNATLIGQSITFFFFVWFCMKMIWPPIMNALESRKKLIADGLAAADRGKHSLELAAKQAADNMRDAKAQATETLKYAGDRAVQFHGGMGFTYECNAQLYIRRAQWSQQQFGDAQHHRKRIAALLFD